METPRSPLENRVSRAIELLTELTTTKSNYTIFQHKHQLDVNSKKVSVLIIEYPVGTDKYVFSLSVDPKTLKIEVAYKRNKSSVYNASFKKMSTIITGKMDPTGEFKPLYMKLREILK